MAKKTNKSAPVYNKTKRKKKKKSLSLKPSVSFVQSDKFKLIWGVFFLILSLYLAFSLISYLFYWTADYDKVYSFQWSHLSEQTPMHNWGGFLGAWMGHLFIYKMFGIPSVLFVLLFFLVGSRLLLQIQFLPHQKNL